MNIFGTVLTNPAPNSNYRGESIENRSPLQKITKGRKQYPIISSESMRNGLRDTFRILAESVEQYSAVNSNRKRLHDQEQLSVEYSDLSDDLRYIDDFYMGWMVACDDTRKEDAVRSVLWLDEKLPEQLGCKPKGENESKAQFLGRFDRAIEERLKEFNEKAQTGEEEIIDGRTCRVVFKKGKQKNKMATVKYDLVKPRKDSVLRVNHAVGLAPYRGDELFNQSPHILLGEGQQAELNGNAGLRFSETCNTSFQYPFALNLRDFRGVAAKDATEARLWLKCLFDALLQLNNVAGNHARTYYEMAPASMVVRVTERLASGYELYGFRDNEEGKHAFPELMDILREKNGGGIGGNITGKAKEYGEGFYLGGRIVSDMDKQERVFLENCGVTLERDCCDLVEEVNKKASDFGIFKQTKEGSGETQGQAGD